MRSTVVTYYRDKKTCELRYLNESGEISTDYLNDLVEMAAAHGLFLVFNEDIGKLALEPSDLPL